MAESLHVPPAGQLLIGRHVATLHCNCKPERREIWKQAASGRGGSHQGRKLARVVYQHHTIEDAA